MRFSLCTVVTIYRHHGQNFIYELLSMVNAAGAWRLCAGDTEGTREASEIIVQRDNDFQSEICEMRLLDRPNE